MSTNSLALVGVPKPTKDVRIGDRLAHMGEGWEVVARTEVKAEDGTRIVFGVRSLQGEIQLWTHRYDGQSAVVVSADNPTLVAIIETLRDAPTNSWSDAAIADVARRIYVAVTNTPEED